MFFILRYKSYSYLSKLLPWEDKALHSGRSQTKNVVNAAASSADAYTYIYLYTYIIPYYTYTVYTYYIRTSLTRTFVITTK
jgi:hypothetical protein